MFKAKQFVLFILVIFLFVSGCDGGGQSNTPDTNTNHAPEISGSPVAATASQSYSFIPTFSDPDGDRLTFSVMNKPGWLSFNTSTGELSGNPESRHVRLYSDIIIRVSDGKLNDELSFNLQVNPSQLTIALTKGDAGDIEPEVFIDGALAAIEQLQKPLSTELVEVKELLTRFSENSFNINLSLCVDKKCPSESNFETEFNVAAKIVKGIFNELDQQKINIFESEQYHYQKMLILLADQYRQQATFPMDKKNTATTLFLQSLFADSAVYNYRKFNRAQTDMGNFSRSDFSHITPKSKTINLESKKSFRSAGVYVIPGITMRITRLDQSNVNTDIFINTLRSGATHEYKSRGYKRPKNLRSQSITIDTGETISLTSSYGGPLQIAFDQNDLPVEFFIENIGEHPYWQGEADNINFEVAMAANEYDWAELVTHGFEVHSTREKMLESMNNSEWNSISALAAEVERYVHNLPHVLAGFKGPGIDVVAEITNFANANNWSIDRIDKVKHMNADQPTCGAGCSGNPYDAGWAFNPLRHGEKIRHCFFGSQQGKMVNCVSASAEAPHIEASIKRNQYPT
jgi:hypothetical protein